MIWQLSIKNLAIIDDISIEFGDGFNILTGETGAGKSIIIDAINLILGGRADRELIRTGEQMATVDAVFTMDSNTALIEKLKELELFDEDASELIISRQIYANGRNANRINGNIVPTQTLKDISDLLIDVHGQHQHQSLLNKQYHRGFLDSFDKEIPSLLEKTKNCYTKWRELSAKIEEIDKNAEDFERNKELLEYQINEIDEAKLKIGEDDELAEQKQIIKNSENIISSLESASLSLTEGKHDGGAIDYLRSAKDKLKDIAEYSDDYNNLFETAENIFYEIEDLADSLHKALRHVSFSPEKLEEIDDRLYLINSLKRKYGKTIEQVLKFRNSLSEDLSDMEYNMGNLEQLKKEEAQFYTELTECGRLLHKKREAAAQILKKRITDELSYLGMKKVQFESDIVYDENSPTSNGCDTVEFLISTNPGEPVKPLAKIASGGEISRIMLSIKSALADIDEIPTMIFDEIDTGISGAVARAAGEKMYALSSNHQIICITHQAQIAALADNHFFVRKKTADGKTKTEVKLLSNEERIEHIAGMISGSVVTDAAREHAKELMKM